jgi:hypothetical protein
VAANGKRAVKSHVDRDAVREVLENLETRLKAYLVEWRREHGIRGASESGIDHTERLPAATGRQKERAELPGPTS